jgi:hypothetical protein
MSHAPSAETASAHAFAHVGEVHRRAIGWPGSSRRRGMSLPPAATAPVELPLPGLFFDARVAVTCPWAFLDLPLRIGARRVRMMPVRKAGQQDEINPHPGRHWHYQACRVSLRPRVGGRALAVRRQAAIAPRPMRRPDGRDAKRTGWLPIGLCSFGAAITCQQREPRWGRKSWNGSAEPHRSRALKSPNGYWS